MSKKLSIIFLLISLGWAQTTEEIKRKIEQSGLSESQVRELAKQQGYTDQQIEAELKKRGLEASDIPQVKQPQEQLSETMPPTPDKSVNQPKDQALQAQELIPLEVQQEQELEVVEEENLLLESEAQPGRPALTYFGYDIFRRDPAVFQASTFGAVDPDYTIGPGDEIIIMLWGEYQFRQVFAVDREGFIFLPNIGQVFVNGLNLSMLESKIFRVMSQPYESLSPKVGKPTSFLDVSLGNLRPLRILVLGEVAQPGAYTVSPSATLYSSLYYFNGPATLGSLRNIHLIRGGQEITTIDFYNYLLTGKKVKDIRLQLDDTIFIPTRGKTVTIGGEVNRPAIYELKKGEKLKDLIAMAGGLKMTAYLDRIQIDRIVPFDLRHEIGMDRMFVDVNLGEILESRKDFELNDGDQVQVFSIMNLRKNVVTVTGSVERPGIYDIGDTLRLSDLITRAEGLLGDAYLDRVDVIRIKSDFTEQLIKLDLSKALALDPEHNIRLQGLDRMRVYSLSEMIPVNYISISGHVKKPGRYQLRAGMTIHDLIFQSGGFLDKQWKDMAYLERADLLRFDPDRITKSIIPFPLKDVLDNPRSNNNFTLLSGDEVRIYSQTVFNAVKPVSIDGVIKSPGQYSLKTGMSIKDLILEAGGLSENVYRYKIEVARVDPEKVSDTQYAEIITLDMDNDFSMSNVQYQYHDNPGEVEVQRNEFLLEPYDYISIRPDPYFRLQRRISVTGAVNYPGTYAILKPDELVTDIIKRAGGMRPEAYPRASRLLRGGQTIKISFEEVLKNPRSKLNFQIQDGDQIFVAMQPNIVSIQGEVNAPGFYKYISGTSVRDYIELAGGLTPDAEKRNIWIEYPGGFGQKVKRFRLSPGVEDGSFITVGKEPESEPVDKTELAKEITSIMASVATTISVIYLATR